MKLYKLGDICKMQSGGTPSRREPSYYKNGTIPWAKIGDIENAENGVLKNTQEYITKEALSSINNRLFPKGTLLFAMYGSVGKVSIAGVELSTNQAILGIIPKVEILDTRYLSHWLKSKVENFKGQARGVALQNLSATIMKSQKIPLPSLETQKKIAAILDKAQELIDNDKKILEKYDQLAQSVFLDMFGDPVTNPKGFFKSTIGEQCSVKGGKRVPKGSKLVKEITVHPYIKAGNIKKGKVTTKNLEYLTPEVYDKIKRYIVDEGDVCITVVGINIGDIGIVPKELHHANLTENANKLLIKNKDKLNNVYLANYLQMDFSQKHIKKRTMAVGVPKLALFRINQLDLLLPPIDFQTRYSEAVEQIELQKQFTHQSLKKSEELFASLLQRAFKGELIKE